MNKPKQLFFQIPDLPLPSTNVPTNARIRGRQICRGGAVQASLNPDTRGFVQDSWAAVDLRAKLKLA